MSQTMIVLVRIAVRIPVPPLDTVDCDPQCDLCTGPCLGSQPFKKRPVAPQVTAEMVAFFCEHPDNN